MSYWPNSEALNLTPIKQLCRLNVDVLPEDTAPDLEFDYVDIGNVTCEDGIKQKERIRFETAPSRARKPVRTGDVIVSTVRTYLKAVARIDKAADGAVVSTGFAVLRPKASIEPSFLYRLCQSNAFVAEVQARSAGVSYPAINPSALAAIKVPLPDLNMQKAIAAFLDRETARIDQLIEKKERQAEVLADKKSATIRELIRNGTRANVVLESTGDRWFPTMPQHWEPIRLRYLFRATKRQDMPRLDVLSVYREYGVILKSSRNDNINKTPEDLSSYQLVEPGDLVINKMKAWQGSLGIAELTGITSPDYLVYRPIRPMIGRFMHYYLRAQPMPSLFLSISNGIRTDQWRLEHEKFVDVVTWLPPLEEQQEIAAAIDLRTAKLERLIDSVSKSIERLKEHRAALITAAVTGQVDICQQPTAVTEKPGRDRFRVIIGAEIVQRHQGNAKFGRIKLQKELYLAEAHAGITELKGTYLREAAGPFDRTLVAETEGGMEASAFFRAALPDIHANTSGVTYTPLPKAGQHRGELEALLGPRATALSQIIEQLSDFDTQSVEAIATLYAVWNDLLIDGEAPDDDVIVRGMLNDWHPVKREKFKDADLRHWLDWMKRNRFIPSGKGPRTISTTSRDMFA